MHAGFQFVFGGFLPHRSAGSTFNSASSTFAKAWNCYAVAKAEPGFFNSPMTGCVAIPTRDLGTTCHEAESNQRLMKRVVVLKTSASAFLVHK